MSRSAMIGLFTLLGSLLPNLADAKNRLVVVKAGSYVDMRFGPDETIEMGAAYKAPRKRWTDYSLSCSLEVPKSQPQSHPGGRNDVDWTERGRILRIRVHKDAKPRLCTLKVEQSATVSDLYRNSSNTVRWETPIDLVVAAPDFPEVRMSVGEAVSVPILEGMDRVTIEGKRDGKIDAFLEPDGPIGVSADKTGSRVFTIKYWVGDHALTTKLSVQVSAKRPSVEAQVVVPGRQERLDLDRVCSRLGLRRLECEKLEVTSQDDGVVVEAAANTVTVSGSGPGVCTAVMTLKGFKGTQDPIAVRRTVDLVVRFVEHSAERSQAR